MMKEISRRAMGGTDEGSACGPVSVYAIDAEIVVEDEGHLVYLYTQWVDAASEDILFEATTESLYDCYEKLNYLITEDREKFNAEIANRDRIRKEADCRKIFGEIDIYERYADQYQQLLQMMQDILDADNINFDLFHIDDFDVDEEE